MQISLSRTRRKNILLVLCIAFLVVLMTSIVSFAGVEERTIHVFPTEVAGVGWEGIDGAREQTLSGAAVFGDFTKENSAHLLESEWVVIDANVSEAEVREQASSSDDVEGTEDIEDSEANSANDDIPEVLDDVSMGQYFFDLTVGKGARAQESSTSSASAEQTNTEEIDTAEGDDTQNNDNAPDADTALREGEDEEEFDDASTTPEVVDETDVEVDEGDTDSADLIDATNENESEIDSEQSEDVSNAVSDDTVDDTEIGTGTEATLNDALVDSENEPSADTSENVDESERETDDSVAVCEILGSECSLLTFTGFGLDWDLEDFEANSFALNLSLASRVETDPGFEDKLHVRYFDGDDWHIANVLSLRGETSNAKNNGHFAFALPEIRSWTTLDDLVVEIEYVRGGSTRAEVFVDGVWIDASYSAPVDEELPELPQLYSELVALEASAEPDVLLKDKQTPIEFVHTDENENETLIIKSDKKIYTGLTTATVYFNVTNTTERNEDFVLNVFFPESRGSVSSLKKWVENMPVEREVPVYAPVAQACEAGWELVEGDGQTESATTSSGFFEPLDLTEDEDMPLQSESETVSVDEAIDDTPAEENTSDVQEDDVLTLPIHADDVVDEDVEDTSTTTDALGSESETEENDEQSVGETVETSHEETQPTEQNTESEPDQDTVESDVSEDALDGATTTAAVPLTFSVLGTSTEAAPLPELEIVDFVTSTPAREENDERIEEEPVPSLGSTTTEAGLSAAAIESSPDEPVESTREESASPDSTEEDDMHTVINPLLGNKVTESGSYVFDDDTPNKGSGTYSCASDNLVLFCDELNADGTNCIRNNVPIGSEHVQGFKNEFIEVGTQEGEQDVDFDIFTRTAQFFGLRPERKEVPRQFEIKSSTDDVHRIDAGQTMYFEMEITYPSKSRGQFWLEAIGKKGGYGLLDPWWNAGWIYRMPLYVDNTQGSLMTEQQIYLELDSSLSDFWTNVQDDGDDIRFLRQTDGVTSWYDPGMTYRLPVTIASTTIPTTFTSFPVYVNLADLGDNFWTNVKEDGGDIRVTGSDGTSELPIDLVSIATTTRTGELHFLANSVSSTTNSTFYLYFGDATLSGYASTTTNGANDVWADYFSVWHMDDGTSADQIDSTANNNTAVQNANGTDASAVLGRGLDFSGNGRYDLTTNVTDNSDRGFSFWYYKRSQGGGNYGSVFGSNNYNHGIRHLATDEMNVRSGGSVQEQTPTLADDAWHYVSFEWDGSGWTGRTSGVAGSGTGSSWFGSDPEHLVGISGATNRAPDGILDEMRVGPARTLEWRDAEYLNQSTTTDFYATSTPETYVAPVEQELDFWIQHFSSSTEEARIWLQVDELEAAASTTLYLYYGNAGAASVSDEYEPFSYSSETELYYTLRDDYSSNESLTVYSYADNNIVRFSNTSATTSLDRGQSTSTATFTSTTTVFATAPLMAKITSTGGNWDSMVPISFASTTFAVGPRDGNTEVWHVGSPFGYASTTIYGASVVTVNTATGSASTQSQGVNDSTAAVVESDIPVLVAFEGAAQDGLTVYPATTEDLYGIVSNGQSSNGPYVGITTDGTTMSVSCSASASTTSGTVNRGDRYQPTNCATGDQGTGEAVRLYNITDAVGASQNADGDGGDASYYWPFREFATEYMMPITTSYVAIACAPETGTVNLSIYDASDSEVATAVCTPSEDGPGKVYFGDGSSDNYTAGYYVASTDSPPKPFFAYYEDNTTSGGGDENNYTGAVQGRKFAYPALSYEFGSQELSTEPIYTQASYRVYANEDAETPTDPWPSGSEDVDEDTEVTSIYAVDDGDILRIRMGVTVSNVPVTAGDNNFKLQYVEAESCDAGGLSWSDVGLFGSGAAWRGYDNATPVDDSALSSTTLSISDVFGTYEEENSSALFPNSIAVGETVEHDWVIENNGANADSSYCFRTVFSDDTQLADYTEYPRVETNSAPGQPQTVTPFDNAKIFDLTPALQFVATDIASDDIHYQVQIDDDFDFSSPVVDESSLIDPTAFSNVTVPSDKAPFSSGNVVQYTVQSALSNGVTYYWRVRGNDVDGSGAWGEWLSPPSSFTTDTGISVSTWFQTTEEQFSTNSFSGAAFASTSDDVRLGGAIGEYGQVTVTDTGWTTVTTDRTYENMIVVASPRYAGNTVPQRSARVRNKTSNTFDIKVDNYVSTTAVTGSTTVDYLVVEEGNYTIGDSASGVALQAGTELTDGQIGNGCETGTAMSIGWSFTGAPMVLHTVTSNSDTQWVASNVQDGSDNEPTNSGGTFYLMTSIAACNHTESEYIDYVAMEVSRGTTTDGTVFETVHSVDTFDRSADPIIATPFSDTFLSVPQAYITSQMANNGGQGSYAFTDTTSPVTVSNFYGSVDEDGPGADRGGNTESGSVIAFTSASGTIEALFDGTMTTTEIDFDDAEVGNRWGSVSWTDTESGGTEILYQVEYETGGGWSLVPDTEIPGNATGTSTSPIDLTNLDTSDYNVIRIVATMSSPSVSATPILSDLTVSWQQSVFTPTHTSPFDNELVGTTTPELVFSTSDPEGDDLTYTVEWSTDSTFTTASSATSSLDSGFRNITDGMGSDPFDSGDTIGFTISETSPLTVGETYWWRVRAVDTGSSGQSFWSDEWSFTASSSVPVSTWFQTTKAQFDNDTRSGVDVTLPGDVTPGSTVGEYGTVNLAAKVWTEVSLSKEFSNPVVVASPEYDSADNTNPNQRRSVRVRNKESNSFEIKVFDYDEADEVTDFSGTTDVDWLVVEAGDWNIEAGAGLTRIVADTVNVSTVLCSTYSGGGESVSFSPAFTNPPAVVATISSDNDSTWAHAGVDDAADANDDNEPTTTTLGLFLGRSHANCNHSPEDIDYVAFEPIHSTNNTVAFEATSSLDTITGSPSATGDTVTFDTAFSVTPPVTIVQQMGEDGGQGGYAHKHTGGTNNASTLSLALEEDGPNTDRGHTNEIVAYVAFASSSGTLVRVPEAISGSIDSQSIVFSEGTGPKWGELTWTDATPSNSTSTFQLLYATSSTFALIPDVDFPGNSTGTSTQPVDLGDLDTNSYGTLRIRNTLECTIAGVCPTLSDWKVAWSEGIDVSGTAFENDETTPLGAGTVRVALNGVEQVTTSGTISGGTWTIPKVNAFPDDIITVWINGAAEANEAVAVTKYDGTGDVDGMVLFERHLTLGSDENPTLTNADLSLYDNSIDEDVFHDVSAGALTVCATGNDCNGNELHVLSGATFRPSSAGTGPVTAHDVEINGVFDADGNTIYVNDSWDNNNGFLADGSTLVFTATSGTETIDNTGAATSSFNSVILGQGSGSAVWQATTSLDIDDAFTIVHGTYAPLSTSTTIGGNFAINANGNYAPRSATTTFDGSGVALWSDATTPLTDIGKVEVTGSGKTLRLQTDVFVNDLTITSGNTLDVTANDYSIDIRGDFRNEGGFTAQNGTINFIATTTGRIVSPGPADFYTMNFNGTGGNWSFPDSDVTADGDFIIADGIVTLPTGTLSVGGSFTNSGGQFSHNNGTVRMTANAPGETVTPGSSSFSSLVFFGSGGWSFGQSNATTSSNFQILAGSVTLPSGVLSVSGDFENEAGTFAHNNGELVVSTVDSPKNIELSGSALHDVRFIGAGGGVGDWFNTLWSSRVPVVVQSSEVDATLSDFPVYIDLAHLGDTFWTTVAEGGSDVRVTNETGTELAIDLVSIATTTRTGELHFKADSVDSSTDTTFYVYIGNPSATAYASTTPLYGSQEVWSDYDYVWHMDEGTAADQFDSTGNGNTAVQNANGTDATGQMGQALDFVDNGRYDLTTNITDNGDRGFSFWYYKRSNGGGNYGSLFGGNSYNDGMRHLGGDTLNVRSGGSPQETTPALANTTWHYVSFEWDGLGWTGRVNETPSTGSGNSWFGTNPQHLMGINNDTSRAIDGILDEARIGPVRAASWRDAEYVNQGSPTTFYATSTTEEIVSRTFVDANASVEGDAIFESGLVTFPSGTLSLFGSLTSTGGTFDALSGETLFAATTSGHTVNPGDSSDFYDVTFNGSGGEWTITGNATSTNDFTLTTGDALTVNSGVVIAVLGTFANALPVETDWGGSTLALKSGTAYTVGTNGQPAETYGTLEIGTDTDVRLWQSDATFYDVDATGSLYSQNHGDTSGALSIWGDYVLTSGTDYWSYATDFDGSDLTGSERQAVVTVATSSSVSFSSSATLEIIGDGAASTTVARTGTGDYSLVFDGATLNAEYYDISGLNEFGLQLLGTTAITSLARGAFTLTDDGGTLITLASTTIDANPALQIFGNSFATTTAIGGYNVTASGTPASYWWFRDHYGNLAGEAFDQNDADPGSIRWDDSGYTINVSGTAYAGLGTGGASSACGVSNNVRLVVDGGAATYDTNCNGTTGDFSFAGVSFSGDATLTLFLNDGSNYGATVSRTPISDITDFDVYEDFVIARHEDAAGLSISHFADFDNSDNANIPFTATLGPDALDVEAESGLLVWTGKDFTPGGDVTLAAGGSGAFADGTLYLATSSSFTAAGSETHTIGGSWVAQSGSTFTAASSDVVFTATTLNKSIEPRSSFNNVTLSGVGGEWRLARTTDVNGDFSVNAGNLIGTSSVSVAGAMTGDGTVELSLGTATIEAGGSFAGDKDWTFYNLTFGDGTANTTTKTGTGDITVNGQLTVAATHTLEADDDVWTLRGSGTVLSVAGTFNPQNSTTTYASSSAMTVAPVTYNNLVLAPEAAGSPTYTFAAGAATASSTLTIGNGVHPVTVSAATNNPLITVLGDVTIASGSTYAGAALNDLLIGGSYTNAGTYTSNGGAILFDSTDTGESIDPGSSNFGTIAFDSATGGWTIVGNATTTGNFSLASASSFEQSSGTTLRVEGIFTNSVGGASTTWTGSTVHIESGSSYQINNKNNNGDIYDTLVLGPNTDLSMWYSTSTTYQVDPSSSLYSQDHNDVNGNLYIWGDYERASGNEYWSYATDFDGTDLSLGASERPVSVYLAEGASTTLSNGSWSITGADGATTTIQSQDGGTYGLTVTGGTFTAQYYQVRDIGAEGLSLSGSPTVTQMGNADLRVLNTNDTTLTIAGSVLDQNPVKTWQNMRFSIDGAAATGTNVTVTGSSISSWRFLPGYGNLYGEDFDDDPAGDPGYAIFTDSAADVTISGYVYSDEAGTPSGAAICDGAKQSVRLVVQGDETASSSASCNGSGFYSISGVTFAPGDTITVYLDTDGGAQAANVTQDLITSIGDMNLYENRVVVRHEDVDPITIESIAAYDSADDADIPFTASTSTTPHTLDLPGNTKLIVWANKTFVPGGDVTLNGSGTANDYDGTLALRTNASYISSTTTSESISIGGSWITESGASFTAGSSTVTFDSTATGRTVSPDMSAFNELIFDGVGGAWTFADRNATTTGSLTITNGDVTFGTSTLAVGGSFINSGVMSASSTDFVFSTSTAATVTFGGFETGSLLFDGSGGSWSITDTDATSTGDVTIAQGAVTLPTGRFAIANGFTNTGGSFTHLGEIDLYGSLAAQGLQFGGSDVYDLTVSGSGSWVFADTNATTVASTTILAGGLTAPTGNYNVGGSFTSSGSFNPNAAHLEFFATTTGQRVDLGDVVLSSVTFNGVGGGWEVLGNATSTGDWRLTSGTEYRQASSTRLEVQGVFENAIGGSGTDWTDSYLYLNASGTSYSINTKAVNGDDYADLELGANTDVRVWNSAAATTTVHASSSLYSMDHAENDGDLYIWGEYTRSSGADYWSYANDFDGTALGGSPRPVDVRIATSSSLLFSGGTLDILGVDGSTTTIDVQGTGLYDIEVAGGTLDASYYSFRNLSTTGLVFSGSPTILDLSYGDFEMAVDDGNLIDVAGATVDQNPTRTFYGMRFATSTGVATGTNITVTGSSANYWRFENEYGNYASEDYDDDGIDACGSMRWTDSTCLEVSQAHYRFRADNGGEGAPDDEWYDQDWGYRKGITVDNPNGTILSEYPVRFDLAIEPEMKSNLADLRFTDESGTTTIPHYVEEQTVATATVWARVPTLPANDTTQIYVYYDNTFAADTASGDDTFIAFDDFEDNNLTEYSGDTTLFDTSGSIATQGSYGLSAASGETESQTTDGIYRDTATTSQGSTIEFYQRVTSGADDEPCTLFAVQSPGSGNQNYAVCLDQYPSDELILVEDASSNDGSGTEIDSTSITYDAGTHWYRVRIDWLTDNSIDITVYDDTDSSIATLSTSDSTYDEGGYGFSFWYQSDGWDFFTSRPYAASEPTATVSATPQQGGGASWTAAQNTALSQDSNTNFRVRMSVENSGGLIENQQLRLQYATKEPYGTCQAVPGVDYDDVPIDSACGTNDICMVASPQFINQESTSQLLETSSGLAFVAGHMVEDPSNQTSAMELATSTLTEVEYAIELTSFADESTYCLRTTNGGLELDSYAQVAEVSVNGVPVITEWTLNNNQNIALTEGTVTAVVATGSVTDLNGATDLIFATSTFYRSGVGRFCTADENNCYEVNSLNCPLSGCAGNSCEVTCTADIQYHAEPTDTDSTYELEEWLATLTVQDLTGNTASSTALGVDVYTLAALGLATPEIDYGTLGVEQDTGGDNKSTDLENTGNSPIDVLVTGSDLTAGESVIQAGNQLYATSSFTYSGCSICKFLSGSSTAVEVDLPKPTSTSQAVLDTLYWGIYVPLNSAGTTHFGTTTFFATPD